jgi:hypothetical protein
MLTPQEVLDGLNLGTARRQFLERLAADATAPALRSATKKDAARKAVKKAAAKR